MLNNDDDEYCLLLLVFVQINRKKSIKYPSKPKAITIFKLDIFVDIHNKKMILSIF